MLASVGRAPEKPGHVKGTSRILVNARPKAECPL
jgi:hypothetical protein